MHLSSVTGWSYVHVPIEWLFLSSIVNWSYICRYLFEDCFWVAVDVGQWRTQRYFWEYRFQEGILGEEPKTS